MVFHTAPPQPASKARMTWPAVLVGGPLASQKGFGLLIPAKLMLRSAMSSSRLLPIRYSLLLKPRMDAARGAHPFGYRVHHFATAVQAVATRKVLRITRLSGFRIHGDAPVLDHHATDGLQEAGQRLLSHGSDHHVGRDPKLRS